MTTDIFIRTYSGDIEWLKYCLQSIQKFVTGIRDVIIVIPESQKNELIRLNLTKEKVFYCDNYQNDYIGQQISKMQAFKWSDADLIVYTDSDCIFTKSFSPDKLLIDGKPLILKTHYSKVGDAICWKAPTEKALNTKIEYEFMRRHPNCYFRKDIKEAYDYLSVTKNMIAEKYLIAQKSFSEFNYLGVYMNLFHPDKYHILDTEIKTDGDDNVRNEFIKQFHSWSGFNESVYSEIKSILHP